MLTKVWKKVAVVLILMTVTLTKTENQYTDPFIVLDEEWSFSIEYTDSQLSSANTIETVLISGDTVLDSPGESIIADRYTCTNLDMKFKVSDPDDPRTITLTANSSMDKPKCTVTWSDGSLDEGVEIDGPTEIEHKYTDFGIYTVSMVCKDIDDNSHMCPEANTECLVVTDFLDDVHRLFTSPMVFFSSEPVLIKSYMELGSNGCGESAINWRINRVDNDTFTPYTNFNQPNSSVIKIEKDILEPGEYVVNLEVTFPAVSPNHWTEDALVIKIVLPVLVTHISGGESLFVPHGGDIYIDATISADPASQLPFLASEPLIATWSFAHWTSGPLSIPFNKFVAFFPNNGLPAGATTYQVQNGSEYVLKIDTTQFPVLTTAAVVFSLIRGTRRSSSMQVIMFRENVLPLKIDCVYNCHVGRERFMYYDKLELDTSVPDEIDKSQLTYRWTITTWAPLINAFVLPVFVSAQTGFTSSAFGFSNLLTQGYVYKITVSVTAPGYGQSVASFIRTVNHIPYGGICTLNTLIATSARDWLTLTCSGWKGNDDRKYTNLLKDKNPFLTFKVIQQSVGALVPEEPILQTRAQKAHLILKVGSAGFFYQSTLFIEITDMFRNYRVILLTVTANPSFDVAGVTPTFDGAALVRSYTQVDYPFDEQQLRDLGKSDMIISLVSAVCSNLHLVSLPVWTPPVPRVLNTDGAVMDLSNEGNSDVGTITEVSEAANNETIDPATLAIQDVMLNMTILVKFVVENDLINGSRKGDKMLNSLVTNAFTNLASKAQFVNVDATVNLVYLSDIVGNDALEPENSTADQSAQIETTSGEIYHMFQAVVNSAVPDDLNQIRPVQDLTSGRTQVGEMLSVIGKNISLNNSLISPVERAYLYMRMQSKLRYQTDSKKESSKEAARVAISLAKNIQEKLKLCKTCSNEQSEKTEQLVTKNVSSEIETQLIPTKTSMFRLDGLQNAIGNESTGSESVSVSAFEFDENVFMYDDDGGSSYVTSNILRIDAKTQTKRVTPRHMTFQQDVLTPEASIITPEVEGEDASAFMYHQFIYQKETDDVCIQLLPLGSYNFTDYEIYVKFSEAPSILSYDFQKTITEDQHWQYCIRAKLMKGHTGIAYLGVSMEGERRAFNYSLTLVTVGCLTWEEEAAKWHPDRCELEWFPEFDRISCNCDNITDMVFANSFFVAPNSIDFSSVFLKFSPLNQAAVMATLIGILLIFLIAVLYLIRLDRRDALKWGITPLRDNIISDTNYYIIKVCTGMRRGAGTESRIAFVLTGDNGDTGPRELFDGFRTEFGTGSIMSFFMATKKHLGMLEHLYIWHDSSGEGDKDSWYLNQVMIYDVERRFTYTFVLERWLSLETTLDAHITSTPQDMKVPFESRFFYQTRDRLSESHMWVSIIYRPQISSFTRVQRASCALVFIFLTMIANAMYFNPEPDYVSPPLLQIGPLRFTSQQIFISIVCALITTPIVMLLIFVFKRTKRRPSRATKPSTGCCECCSSCTIFCRRLWHTKAGDERRRREEHLKSMLLSPLTPDFSGGIYLPWWCIYFAWTLVLVGTLVPAFFILLYSMEWGKQKSEEWLSTFFMSLFESMLFVDPITVICIAFVLALLIRSNKSDCSVDVDIVIENYRKLMGYGKDHMMSTIKLLKSIKTEYDSYMSMPRTVTPPLQGNDLAEAANRHARHVQLMTMLKDFILNVFFMLILLTICFSNRDNRSFLHYTETVNTIVEPWKLPQFNAIKTPGDLYSWVNMSVFPSLFPEFDITGNPLHWTSRQFTTGSDNFRLGPPRLRQMRTRNGTCNIPYIGETNCYGEYSVVDEEDEDYCIGWHSIPCDRKYAVFNVSMDAWKFKSAFDVWGLPLPGLYTTYGGGGYICTLAVGRNNSIDILNELFRNLWMDRQTRAVMFEFTLYNGATNMFIYHVFLVEFPQTGGAFTSFSIYPIRVYTHTGGLGTLAILCEVIFVIYLIALIVKICVRIYQQRCGYFKQFWQVYEVVVVVLGITAIAIYALRLGLTYLTIKKFKKDKNLFVDFSHIVLWDQILVALLAILVFMVTLRILEIFATSKKVNGVVKVFVDCGTDLFWFGITFFYFFVGFCFLGMLLFGSQLWSYMSMYQTMGTLFIAMIGKSHFAEINETQPILAKVFFMFYVFTVVFFILTIFLSILGASIDKVVHDTREDKTEDIIEYLMTQLKHVFVTPESRKDVKVKDKNDKDNVKDTNSKYEDLINRDEELAAFKEEGNETRDGKAVLHEPPVDKSTLVNSWLS